MRREGVRSERREGVRSERREGLSEKGGCEE